MSIIQKHIKEGLGSLTTITNPTTGKTMFIAKEVAEQWGHTNLTQALKRTVSETEKKLIKKGEFPVFIQELVLNGMLSAKAQSIWLISESGLYELILASNLETAQPFKDWVTKDVLPNIRKYGSYNLKISRAELHAQTDRLTQLNNSKLVNTENYKKNGVGSIIEYNKANCKQVTGLEPKGIKNLFNASKSKSAKEVLRQNKPEMAAVMSLNDHLVINHHVELAQLRELDKAFLPAFIELNKLGIEITE